MGRQVVFKTSPRSVQQLTTPRLSIRCSLQEVMVNTEGGCPTDIDVLHCLVITKEGEDIARITSTSPPVLTQAVNGLTVEGEICLGRTDGELGYLQLEWINPGVRQTGWYHCVVAGIGRDGRSRETEAKVEVKHVDLQLEDMVCFIQDLKSEINGQAKEISDLKLENKQQAQLITDQNSVISQLKKNNVKTPPVFFTGRLSGDLSDTSHGQVVVRPLVFDHLIDQSGDSYNQSSGVFTAPVKGVYVASVTAVTEPGKHGCLWFLHNNRNIDTWAIANIDDNIYSSGSSTVTVLMETGDTFKVVSLSGTYYHYRTSCSIHLVHAV